jgi:hypothetical protein
LLPRDSLKDLLHRADLTRTDKLLLCLAVQADRPKSVKQIRTLAAQGGLRIAQTWNISDSLKRSRGRAVRTPAGWELTASGKEYVGELAGPVARPAATRVAASLRSHLTQISDPQTVTFIDEAIRCLEARLYRAAVVLSWVGAVSVLYNYVVKNKLSDFNTEAQRRDPKWRMAQTKDDLARMKEYDFLDILEAISVIGKSVKQQLRYCLQLRNGCGHPSSLQISENRVSAHIETLILNVFSRFSL